MRNFPEVVLTLVVGTIPKMYSVVSPPSFAFTV